MARRSACGDGARLVERLDERRGRRLGAVALPVAADEVLLAVESRLRRPGWPTSAEEGLHLRLRRALARSRGDSGRAPRGRGRAGPTWPPDPLAWLGSASGAAPLPSRARPGKKSVARVVNTGAHDERSHGVKRGRRGRFERLVEDARLGSLAVARDVAEAARPAPQRATSAHLDEKLLFGRSCPGGPGYARPPRRRAASGGRPREAASRAPAAFAARDDRALPRTKPRRSSVFYFSIFSGAAPSRGSLTCRRGWSSPRAGAGRRTSSSPSRRRPPPGRAASGR